MQLKYHPQVGRCIEWVMYRFPLDVSISIATQEGKPYKQHLNE